MLEAAGSNVFSWNFIELYGMNPDQLVPWNTFLQGKSDVASLAEDLAGHHGQGREGRFDQESRGAVTTTMLGRAEQGTIRALSALAPP